MVGFLAIALAGVAPSSRTVDAAEPPSRKVADGMYHREMLGLRADVAHVADLVGSASDVGTEEWSIPMTEEEEKEVNLAGRATFLRQAEESLLPYVRQLDTFAGVWQDQQHDGRLVVMLTSVDDAVVKAIRAREPKDSRGIRIEQATYSYAQLRRAMETLTSDWDRLMRGAEFVGVGLSERNNALDIDVVSEDMDKVESAMRSTKDELAVPLILREGDSGRDAGCNPRGDCYPLRGGAKIYKGSLPSNLNCTSCYFCTVGFLVYTQSDAVENSPRTQLLTAGHCGYAAPSSRGPSCAFRPATRSRSSVVK